MTSNMIPHTTHDSKAKLLDAAQHAIRLQGDAANAVEDICHRAGVTNDVEAAKKLYAPDAPDAPWSADSVGYFIQSVLQGAFIFARAKRSPRSYAKVSRI